MSKGLRTKYSIDEAFERAARHMLDAVKPKILLIGDDDKHLSDIANYYQWAEHSKGVPRALSEELSLIVVNSERSFKQVLDRAHANTAILAYDDERPISFDIRENAALPLVCYLNSVSERFLRGHVRILLQLRKHFLAMHDHVPLVLTCERMQDELRLMFGILDRNEIVDVGCDDPTLLFAHFRCLSALTRYENPKLVMSPKDLTKGQVRKGATLVLFCNAATHKGKYSQFALEKCHVVFVHNHTRFSGERFRFFGIGKEKADYYLVAYLICLQRNLCDVKNKTKFIQVGDIDRVVSAVSNIASFVDRLNELLSGNTLRFRVNWRTFSRRSVR